MYMIPGKEYVTWERSADDAYRLRATRNPRSTTRVDSALSSSRCAARRPVGLLVHEPPRFTRLVHSPSCVLAELSVVAPSKFGAQQSSTHSKTFPSMS